MPSDERSAGGAGRDHGGRSLVEQKVRQVLYGGETYDAATVFDTSEYRQAKRMLSDHVRPDGDDLVVERAETAVEQITEATSNAE